MICRECRQEVRFGYRSGVPDWWHFHAVDHAAIPIVEDSIPATEQIPSPEIQAQSIMVSDERVPGGCKQMIRLAESEGWRIVRLSYARGPYLGADGSVLSISDSVVLRVRSEPTLLDSTNRLAVAFWRDGSFDFAYVVDAGTETHIRKVNSNQMKNWIKGQPLQESDQ